MRNHSQDSPTPQEKWLEDTNPIIDDLLGNGHSSLHGKDSIGWMLYVVERLQTRSFDHLDLAHIISTFMLLTSSILERCRFLFQECLIVLLLLKHSPYKSSQCRNEWKNTLADRRLKIEALYHENNSLKPFISAMIRYAWPIARNNAVSTLTHGLYIREIHRSNFLTYHGNLSHWNDQIETDCPWTAHEILNFSLDPNDPDHRLSDTRALPFEEL